MPNEYKLSYTGKEIDAKLSEIDKKVGVESQTFTEAEKTQARTNIGAALAYTYGTEDIEAGSASTAATGTLHFVYEAG